jgi:hypothetical protein
MKYLLKFIKLPIRTKLILMEAYLMLSLAGLLLWAFKFKKIARLLGRSNRETAVSNVGIDPYLVRQVANAIRTMSPYTLRKSKCLVQAFAAKLMLRRRKQRSTLYLGVAKAEDKKMIAHAWLRCGKLYVTGGDGSITYAITGKFAS